MIRRFLNFIWAWKHRCKSSGAYSSFGRFMSLAEIHSYFFWQRHHMNKCRVCGECECKWATAKRIPTKPTKGERAKFIRHMRMIGADEALINAALQ